MNDEPKFTITARGMVTDPRHGRTEREWNGLFDAMAIEDPTARGEAITALVTGQPSPAPKAKPEPLANIHARMARHAMFPAGNRGGR